MARFDGPSKFIRVMFSNAAAGAGETMGAFYSDIVKINVNGSLLL